MKAEIPGIRPAAETGAGRQEIPPANPANLVARAFEGAGLLGEKGMLEALRFLDFSVREAAEDLKRAKAEMQLTGTIDPEKAADNPLLARAGLTEKRLFYYQIQDDRIAQRILELLGSYAPGQKLNMTDLLRETKQAAESAAGNSPEAEKKSPSVATEGSSYVYVDNLPVAIPGVTDVRARVRFTGGGVYPDGIELIGGARFWAAAADSATFQRLNG